MSAAADERSVAQLLVLKSHHWVCCCFGMKGWRCPAPLCQDHIFLFVSLDSLHSSGRCWSCDSASNRLCVQHPLLWPSHLLKPQLSLRGLYSTIQHNTTQHRRSFRSHSGCLLRPLVVQSELLFRVTVGFCSGCGWDAMFLRDMEALTLTNCLKHQR